MKMDIFKSPQCQLRSCPRMGSVGVLGVMERQQEQTLPERQAKASVPSSTCGLQKQRQEWKKTPFWREGGTSLYALLHSRVLWLKQVALCIESISLKHNKSDLCPRPLPFPWRAGWGWPRKAIWTWTAYISSYLTAELLTPLYTPGSRVLTKSWRARRKRYCRGFEVGIIQEMKFLD